MKILVTGGAGFIGSHIIDALRARGDDVLCVDSLDPGVHHHAPTYLRDDVDYAFADLRHWRPDERIEDVEVIIHLAALGGVSRAAREPENVLTANAGGTARLIELTQRMPKLRSIVLASSFSIYGSNYTYSCPACGARRNGERKLADLERGEYGVRCDACGTSMEIQAIDERATPGPLETYGASKYMQELCFRGFSRCPVHIMRFSSVYGTRLRLDDGEATIIAKLAGWIRDGVSPSLFEDGQQIRDWVYVGDVVDTALALSTRFDAAEVVNVCSGRPATLAEACALLAEAMGTTCEPRIVGGFRAGDMRHCLGDPSTFKRVVGRDPTPLDRGTRLTFGS